MLLEQEVGHALEQALSDPALRASIAPLMHVIAGLLVKESSRSTILNDQEKGAVSTLLRTLAGQQVATTDTLVSFGENQQLGDVTIHDVVGGNQTTVTINVPAYHTPGQHLTRSDAYRALFQQVNDAYLAMRQRVISEHEFQALQTDLNVAVLRNALLIDKADHLLVYRFLKAVRFASSVIQHSNNPTVQDAWAATASLSVPAMQSTEAVATAIQNVDAIHTYIVDRFRQVIDSAGDRPS